MELSEYQKRALLSVAITEKNVTALAHRTLGLAGEAGEVASIVKKIIRDKNGKATATDKRKIAEKLGDTLYYVAVLAEYYGIELEDIANKNLDKSETFRKSRK
jgi:NTP pyrophosphatase (non-canonical NTP hydrolase)